jgi:AmiR/NasT family two-component response regulator
MNELRADHLRLLVAGERRDRLALVAVSVCALGHEIVAQEIDPSRAGARRALTERAKGILMERHATDEASAFEILRGEAHAVNLKVGDVAVAVVETHSLSANQPVAP